MPAAPLPPEVASALAAWDLPLDGATAARPPSGLIQATWIVELGDGSRCVAQRMIPLFGMGTLEDIDEITTHLADEGLETQRLVHTRDGHLGVRDAEGRLWRVLTYLDGVTIDRVSGAPMAEEAARLVARFHRALARLPGADRYEFRFVRAGVHDTAGHLRRLEGLAGLARRSGGKEDVVPMAADILAETRRLPALGDLPLRLSHGDLKISNVLFARGGTRARALIDLDTLGRLTMAYELGDAWRSWCNPEGEDTERTRFDLEIFAGAVRGYAEAAAGLLDPAEIGAIVPGVQTVALELAARFCADAFEESYFGWDPTRFASRAEHNRVRAAGQLALARRVAAASRDADEIVRRTFAEAARRR